MVAHSLLDEYNDMYKQQKQRYGPRTVLLIEVGSFFECYSPPNFDDTKTITHEIADALNMICTRKDKKKHASVGNPYMAGFPSACLDRHVQVLLRENFTVVLCEQVTPPPNPTRKITKVLSSTTCITTGDPDINKNKITSIHDRDGLFGIATVDVSTGDITACEVHGKDAMQDHVNTLASKETFFTCYSDNTKPPAMKIKTLNDQYKKISFQENFLKKLYPNITCLQGCSIIEMLDLERTPAACFAFVALIQHIYEHDPSLLENMKQPMLVDLHKTLASENNTHMQLDIINASKTRNGSVFNIVNHTSTKNGERELRERIANPSLDPEVINARYDITDMIIESKLIEKIENTINKFPDSQRLHRKQSLGRLSPLEFSALVEIYENIRKLSSQLPPKLQFKEVNDIDIVVGEIAENYKIDHLDSCLANIWKPGIHDDIDKLCSDIAEAEADIKEILDKINAAMTAKLGGQEKIYCKLDSTDKDGKYVSMTKKRYDVLKTIITCIIGAEDFKKIKTTAVGSNFKITWPRFNELSNRAIAGEARLKSLSEEYFTKEMIEFSRTHARVFGSIDKYIGTIDCSKSYAKTSVTYKYNRPTIIDADSQTIRATAMRHAIVERINEDEVFVANDLVIDAKNRNILIYGTNASGKSTILKGLGICIILAQAGMHVPADKFEYTIFSKIFSRISGDDNLFAGKSSFAVEVSELKRILAGANSKSLVLADEVCRGTESTSGLAIVASAIERLIEKDTSLVLATHLHQLPNYIKHESVKTCHLSIEKNEDVLVYNRVLQPGPGPATYGIEIASFMINDKDFIKRCHEIRREISGQHQDFLNPKPSRYNANVFMDMCSKCKINKAVDTHHINYQENADTRGFIGHFHKNVKANLMPLCVQCHRDEHADDDRRSNKKAVIE